MKLNLNLRSLDILLSQACLGQDKNDTINIRKQHLKHDL